MCRNGGQQDLIKNNLCLFKIIGKSYGCSSFTVKIIGNDVHVSIINDLREMVCLMLPFKLRMLNFKIK